MNVGLDIGYAASKAISGERRVSFPSVVGSPDRPAFSLDGDRALYLDTPGPALVGEGAVEQSRFWARREDRRWVESHEWYTLAMAALSELTTASGVELCIVTGLPVAFYGDRELVLRRLRGGHRVQRHGRHAQSFAVTSCRVIPQPFGAVLAATLDTSGRIVDNALALGRVGLIDVGGKTTNLLSVHGLREVGRETTSLNAGAWDCMRAVRAWLAEHCPDLELRDHQVIDAMIARRTRYYGEPVDLGAVVDEAVEPLADQVIAAAGQLWNGAAALDAILIAGGGALMLGDRIRRHFRHARVVEDPVFANAQGFWRYAVRMAGRGHAGQ